MTVVVRRPLPARLQPDTALVFTLKYMAQRIPEFVYKYMSAENAIRLITERLLKFTPPNEFNDAFEFLGQVKSVPNFFVGDISHYGRRLSQVAVRINNWSQDSLKWKKQLDDWGIAHPLTEAAIRELACTKPVKWRLLMHAHHTEALTQQANQWQDTVSKVHGVACFSGSPMSQLMWTFYADESRGAVVQFDTAATFFDQLPLKAVRYSKSRADFLSLQRRKKISQSVSSICKNKRRHSYISFVSAAEPLLLTKHVDYAFEKEWRVCTRLSLCRKRVLKKDGNLMYFRRIHPSAIRSVTVGPRCASKEGIYEAVCASMPHVQVRRISLSRHSYGFELQHANS